MDDSLAQQIEDVIPNDATVISIKINNIDVEEKHKLYIAPIQRYLESLKLKILGSAAGIHLNGKSQKPHIHYHLICEKFIPPVNPSQHRQRWMVKNDEDLGDVSFRFKQIDCDAPKYSILSYPLKEGRILNSGNTYTFASQQMSDDILCFLTQVGKAIYDKELGLKLRQEKCEERKQLSLLTLFQLCSENRNKFTTYNGMMLWLDDNYIANLEIEEYPDPRNYKTNCQKIAVKLNLLKYSSI